MTKKLILNFLTSLFLSNTYAQVDGCLLFNGSNNRVTIPHITAYNLDSGAFTVEAIVKMPDGQDQFSTLFSNRAGSSDGLLLATIDNLNDSIDGDMYMRITDNNWIIWNGEIPDLHDDQFHHIVYQREFVSGSTDTLHFWIDDMHYKRSTSTENVSTSHDIWVGWDDGNEPATAFKGNIKELRFWKTMRSDTELDTYSDIELHPSQISSDLVGYWKFNEGTGDIVNDYSIFSNNGYLGSVKEAVDINDPVWATECPSIGYPKLTIFSGDSSVCLGTTDTLRAIGGDGNFTWSALTSLSNTNIGNDDTVVVTTNENTSYFVQDNSGNSDTIHVELKSPFDCGEEPELHVYNVITPNNDGKNETLMVSNIEFYPGNEIRIYNLWSDIVYKKENYDNSWDGGNLPSGTYTYQFIQNENIKTGQIRIIR